MAKLLRVLNFKYDRGSIFRWWKDANKGNCQDYAWTTLKKNEGGTLNALKAILKGDASIRRARSPVNKWWWPRHAVLHYKGQWIDSTVRTWRASPAPHKALWPALPGPITVAIVVALCVAVRLHVF
jgi:hypothetical protein